MHLFPICFVLEHVRTELNPGAPVERDPRIHGHAVPLRSARIALEAAAPGPTRENPGGKNPSRRRRLLTVTNIPPDDTGKPVVPISVATAQTTTG